MFPAATPPTIVADEEFLADDDIADVAYSERHIAAVQFQQRSWHLVVLILSTLTLLLSASLQVVPGGRVAFRWWPEVVLPETCMAKVLSGLNCPGCGLTRSFVFLTHGQFVEAITINRAGLLLYGLLLLQFPYRCWMLRELRQGRLNRRTWPLWLGALVVVSVFANWLIGWLGMG